MSQYFSDAPEKKQEHSGAALLQRQQKPDTIAPIKDNRPEAVAQQKLQEKVNNSDQITKHKALKKVMNGHYDTKKTTQLQKNTDTTTKPVQKTTNQTGLPDHLKSGIENLSGYSMDDVKVHRNSDKPAQLQAHAYAQGTDIHLAPGQERYLPHEAWHVVQQKQGRVEPTRQMKGKVKVNDDAGLEKEADVMGAKALGAGKQSQNDQKITTTPVQRMTTNVVQRAGHKEDLCILPGWIIKRADVTEINQYTAGEVPGIAPDFVGPFYTVGTLRAALGRKDITLSPKQLTKVQTMKKGIRHGGRGFILLKNAKAGMTNPTLRDLKLGKHTVSGTDQGNHGNTGIRRVFKVIRHDVMDKFSGTREQGFRDEDRWQDSKLGDNLDKLNAMLAQAGPVGLTILLTRLRHLLGWVNASNVVYVGMSLLIVVDPPPLDSARAVAIDFEHPIRNTDASFNTHKAGLIDGITNIINIVSHY